MFGKLFGWRKASKCKKLIGRVQCRLKLLKNKRSCIARQLREDLFELLKNGHHQLVFDRVEQLFMDENLVAVYDLLDYYCGFIIINLPYIRKHKDCPNDINEAVSTLIYSSARLGDLPELLSIRKLFGERYGQRFATVARDLLPGNLVNRQIKENLSVEFVSDDVKYRLVDEITRSCFQHGPLLLGYTSEWQKQENKAISDQVPRIDVQNSDKKDEHNIIRSSKTTDREGKIVFHDDSHEIKECSNPVGEFAVSGFNANSGEKKWGRATTSSSESVGKSREEMVYLDDDIAEFESTVSKDAYLQDQRLFMFKSLDPMSQNLNTNTNKGRSGKVKNASTRKLSKRQLSREITSVTDIQTAIYYGKSRERRHHKMKILVKESYESIDEPSLFTFIVYKNVDSGKCSSKCPTNKTSTPKGNNQREKIYAEMMSSNAYESEGVVASGEESSDSSVSSLSERIDSWKRKHNQNQPPYIRAITMPPERPNNKESISRSNSFPVQQPEHVHPKLPDYDELSARFMALKKEKIQNKCNHNAW